MKDWEWVEDGYIRRLRTPMGWLVQAYADIVHDRSEYGQGRVSGWDYRIALTFVFDPFHW
jgi:hypothetical protein